MATNQKKNQQIFNFLRKIITFSSKQLVRLITYPLNFTKEIQGNHRISLDTTKRVSLRYLRIHYCLDISTRIPMGELKNNLTKSARITNSPQIKQISSTMKKTTMLWVKRKQIEFESSWYNYDCKLDLLIYFIFRHDKADFRFLRVQ